MSRIPQITSRDAVSPDTYPIFDSIVASRGAVRGPFTVLMYSPEVARRVAEYGAFVRFESSLPSHLREAAATTVVREYECAYEWAMHSVSAPEAGVSPATMAVIRDRASLDSLPSDEQAVIRYARELVATHHVTDDTFAAVHAILGDKGTAELTAAIGYYCAIGCVLNALEVPAPEGPTPPLPGGPHPSPALRPHPSHHPLAYGQTGQTGKRANGQSATIFPAPSVVASHRRQARRGNL
ncbi:MAG: hypothetical protein GEU75_09030 [Dehalococcoidia bacterium]|nr:hypothetical protein [Dehalococcoidia bacterium]